MTETHEQKYKVPPRLYYTLAQAAKKLDCEIDHLLHLGSLGVVEFCIHYQPYATPSKRLYIQNFIDFKKEHTLAESHLPSSLFIFIPIYCGEVQEIEFYGSSDIRITSDCIIEVSNQKLETIYAWELAKLSEYSEQVLFLSHECPYDLTAEYDDISDEEIAEQHEYDNLTSFNITPSNLYIMCDEVDKFIENSTGQHTEKPSRKQNQHSRGKSAHRNAIRFSNERERIYSVAIACKEHFPDKCKDGAKWADCICENWWRFDKDDPTPPREATTIAGYLNEALILPK